MKRSGRIIMNILPYYFVKKIVYSWGKHWRIIKPDRGAADWTAQGIEIDYGEWLMIADEEALMKERKIIEGHLKKNQERLDELKQRGA
jgi:hypothetical protein